MKQKRRSTKEVRSKNTAAVKRRKADTVAAAPGMENREHKNSVFVDLFYGNGQ